MDMQKVMNEAYGLWELDARDRVINELIGYVQDGEVCFHKLIIKMDEMRERLDKLEGKSGDT